MSRSEPDSPLHPISASFRDPSGFLYAVAGQLYRQVNRNYQPHYDALMQSGLYEYLVKAGWLIPHQEVAQAPARPELAYRILQPEPVAFISYPYEWSFSQLQDAALLTLQIQKTALEYGMWLKDSSAYNIQFHNGRPILVDTLSFELYSEGSPWVAYRQFCQHFLAPLSLMAKVDIRLGSLLRTYLDGIPLDLASRLLPRRTRFQLPLLLHIHTHAASQKRYAGQAVTARGRFSKAALLGLIDSLEAGIRSLRWSPAGTAWGDYYDCTNYTPAALKHKEELVAQFVEQVKPCTVWDLGANVGRFSRLASQRGIFTVAFDVDPGAVEQAYRQVRQNQETHLLPLLLDLTNPSPSLGWHHRERQSLIDRGPAEMILSLALLHHLAIGNNTPLEQIADFLADLGRWLVIEFVPKEDSQVQRLLASRQDIFTGYTLERFEQAFTQKFRLHRSEQIHESQRRLYLMERR